MHFNICIILSLCLYTTFLEQTCDPFLGHNPLIYNMIPHDPVNIAFQTDFAISLHSFPLFIVSLYHPCSTLQSTNKQTVLCLQICSLSSEHESDTETKVTLSPQSPIFPFPEDSGTAAHTHTRGLWGCARKYL